MSYSKSAAQSGRGSVLSVGVVTTVSGVTTTTWTTVGEVKEVAFSGNTTETVDVTNFESGNFKELLPVIIDSGTAKLSGNRVSGDAGQTIITSAFQTFSVIPLRVVLPLANGQSTTGDTITWAGLIQSSDFTVAVDKEVDFSVTIKNSGAITTTVGS